MNKTLSVNIGGIVFHIEELAYEKLNRYLEAIKGYFTTSDGRDEIIQDIEGRIGEMFQERVTTGKQVIIESDVEQIINIMGRPEQFAGMHEESESPGTTASYTDRKTFRRLYRDADDQVIGGVCSGLGHYLGIDPVWFRIAFAVALFVFGSGLLLYIILWLVMPKAVTTAEKLEMKGEQVNISNIKKSVQSDSGYSQVASKGVARFFDALGQLLTGAFRLLGKIIAACFIVVGIFMLIAFALAFLAIMGVGGISIPFFITDLFMNSWQQTLALTSAFLVIGIPLIMVIFKAVKVLFNVKVESRYLNWTAFALWIVGVILSVVVVSSIARDFKIRETQRTEIHLMQPATDTLFLDVLIPDKQHDDWYDGGNVHINDPWDPALVEDTFQISDVRLNIVKSSTAGFELLQVASARGEDRRDAVNNTRAIIYHLEQQDSLIRFDESFLLPKGSKYRNQKLQLILKVPEGKSVYMSEAMEDVIYDIKNVTNTYDGDMVGRTWTMTSKGLECIGCGLPDNSGRDDEDFRIRINEKGVDLHGIDGEKDTTYDFDGKDVDININKEGVEIKTR